MYKHRITVVFYFSSFRGINSLNFHPEILDILKNNLPVLFFLFLEVMRTGGKTCCCSIALNTAADEEKGECLQLETSYSFCSEVLPCRQLTNNRRLPEDAYTLSASSPNYNIYPQSWKKLLRGGLSISKARSEPKLSKIIKGFWCWDPSNCLQLTGWGSVQKSMTGCLGVY